MARGRFVTFEGIDGCGKTTHVKRAYDHFAAQGLSVLLLREPGGTALGERLRSVLLNHGHVDVCDVSELLLFEAARAQLVREVITPALDGGALVLCDRFIDSTVAYQGYGRGLDLEWIDRLNRIAIGDVEPDLTLWLDARPAAIDARLTRRRSRDRMETSLLAFRERTRRGFQAQYDDHPTRIVRVETERSKDDTAREVIELIGRLLV